VVPALEVVVVSTADAAVWIPSSANPRNLVEDVSVPETVTKFSPTPAAEGDGETTGKEQT
jgi:hypothetical protein